ncbi:hypothetical protein XELAEV_18032515mg [Xenopus laevis]|uniref:Uncharacterized protein n=1 Tax=Xenopus laevis TaxID=8355 RepID=A0A974HGQ8_XENLA|nr:hypothetical protein XELAEV_18032515mg [Xenopus laevis]
MMATAMSAELTCSVCLELYKNAMMLECGHSFCQSCIEEVLKSQDGPAVYTCPQCRRTFHERPSPKRNLVVCSLAEHFFSTHPEQDGTRIFCTYCVLSPVPAVRSCLLCEASLCDTHLRVHSKSAEHVLTQPTDSFAKTKCLQHKKLLEYYCCEDSVCICVSCYMVGEHRGHRVELLSEASEKKKETLRKVVEKLRPEREETERGAQRLQERRREVAEKAAGETERVTALFRDIREQLEALEKRLLSDISSQKEKLSLTLTDLMEQLEIKKDELSRKIRHIEELCNMADPLTVLQERESHGAADNEGGREGHDIKVPAVGDLDVDLISETLLTGLAAIVTGEATDLLLDINTAHNNVSVSGDRKSASYSPTDPRCPQSPKFIKDWAQALSSRSFPSGRHYWDVEVSGSKLWGVGVTYANIGGAGEQPNIGLNSKSWALIRRDNNYIAVRESKGFSVAYAPFCRRIRVSLDYEAGRLSFYHLSDPIKHLFSFTATFTEPLRAALSIGEGRLTFLT